MKTDGGPRGLSCFVERDRRADKPLKTDRGGPTTDVVACPSLESICCANTKNVAKVMGWTRHEGAEDGVRSDRTLAGTCDAMIDALEVVVFCF